jgi:hypothetical protein
MGCGRGGRLVLLTENSLWPDVSFGGCVFFLLLSTPGYLILGGIFKAGFACWREVGALGYGH